MYDQNEKKGGGHIFSNTLKETCDRESIKHVNGTEV